MPSSFLHCPQTSSGGSPTAQRRQRDHVDQRRLAAAALPCGHEKRWALREQCPLDQRHRQHDGDTLANPIERDVDQPLIEQINQRRPNILLR